MGSARHTRNLWRGLEQAEKDGTAKEMVSRENLLKVEPHRLLEKLKPSNALSTLAGHLTLNLFPAEVGSYPANYDNYRERYSLSEQTPESELRKQYFDSYKAIKNEIEKGSSEGLHPLEIMKNSTKLASNIISQLRGTDKPRPEGTSPYGPYGDAMNPVAYGLSNFIDRVREGLLSRPNKNSPMGRLKDFVERVQKKYGSASNVETLDHIVSHVGDIIEGDSFNKTFGTVKKGGQKIDVSRAYSTASVVRTGGRKINATTVDDASKHLMGNVKLRGVQWGNSVTDDERKHHATKLSEALADLADTLGVSDSAISLGGKLGIAIGARGKGGALAHYEPDQQVINLTRSKGVGSLAHEWAHALDHSIEQFQGFASERIKETPIGKAMSAVRQSIGNSGYSDRLRDVLHQDQFATPREREYWKSHSEVFARTMERYIQRKLHEAGRENTYLVGLHKKTDELWPNDDEMKSIEKPMNALIDAIRENHLK